MDPSPPDLLSASPACYDGPCRLDPLPTPAEAYHPLDPFTVQCSAAANANLANLVRLERHWASVIIECDSQYVGRNLCLNRDLLSLHEADLRADAAASALTALYQLAALEAREHYLDLAIAENQRSLDRIDDLGDVGLPADVDRGAIAVSQSKLKDQRLQLQYARLQLNGQLQQLLDCPSCEFRFFWPEIDWKPSLEPLSPDEAVELGLASRTDTTALGLVLCQLEKSTIRVARGVLNVADRATGSVEPTEGWIHRLRCICCSDHELDVRCRQLRMLYKSTEALATAEIKSAVYKIALQQQRVALAQQTAAARQRALDELLAKRDVEGTPVFEISRARGRLYQAHSDLIDQVAGLKIAEVELRQTQGMLAADCGFRAVLCCDGPCDGVCMRCEKR